MLIFSASMLHPASRSGEEKPQKKIHRITLNESYAKKYKVRVPVEVTFSVPLTRHLYVLYPPQTGGSLIKFTFANEKKQFLENFQLTTLKVDLTEQRVRVNTLKKLLENKAFKMAAAGKKNARIEAAYYQKTAGVDSYIVEASYNENGSKNFLKIIGYLNPDSEHGIVAIAYYNGKLSAVKNKNDLKNKGITAAIFQSVQFGNVLSE